MAAAPDVVGAVWRSEAARKIFQVHVDNWSTWEGEIEVRQVMG